MIACFKPDSGVFADNLMQNLRVFQLLLRTVCHALFVKAVLGEDIEYGSKIIGEIVIQAALTSNKIKEISHPNIKELVKHKLINVLGCAGKADECK